MQRRIIWREGNLKKDMKIHAEQSFNEIRIWIWKQVNKIYTQGVPMVQQSPLPPYMVLDTKNAT